MENNRNRIIAIIWSAKGGEDRRIELGDHKFQCRPIE
jgi:hypothetical protein